MIDDFALGLTMALIGIAAFRLLGRKDLDIEPDAAPEAANDGADSGGPRRFELKLPGNRSSQEAPGRA